MSRIDGPYASQTLLAAALAGLLCAAPAACTSPTEVGSLPDAAGEETGSSGAPTSSSSGSPAVAASTSSGGASSSGGSIAPGDAGSVADAAADAGPVSLACADGIDPAPHVTASTTVPDLTLDAFTTECDERGGVVAIEPHCGGSNACRGFFYDTATHVRTEHTCRGTNTCAGYSCIDCDD